MFFITDMFNHITAVLIRRHIGKQIIFTIKDADTRRSVYLMSGKCQKITVKIFHVYFLCTAN